MADLDAIAATLAGALRRNPRARSATPLDRRVHAVAVGHAAAPEALVEVHADGTGRIWGHLFVHPPLGRAVALLVHSRWTSPADDAARVLASYRARVVEGADWSPVYARSEDQAYGAGATIGEATAALARMIALFDPDIVWAEDPFAVGAKLELRPMILYGIGL